MTQTAESARDIFEKVVVPAFEGSDGAGYLDAARNVAQQISAIQGEVTIDQVRALCPPPADQDPRIMGAVFSPRKHWVYRNQINSSRNACHGRPVGVWQYIGAPVAGAADV